MKKVNVIREVREKDSSLIVPHSPYLFFMLLFLSVVSPLLARVFLSLSLFCCVCVLDVVEMSLGFGEEENMFEIQNGKK